MSGPDPIMADVATISPSARPAARRRSRRERAQRWAALGAMLALALPAVAFLVLRLAVPSDGTHLRPGSDAVRPEGLAVAPLGPGPLEPGDVVVAVGDVPIGALAQRFVGGTAPARPADGADEAGVEAGGDVRAAPSASQGDASTIEEARRTWLQGEAIPFTVLRGDALVRIEVPLAGYPLGAVVARTWGTILFALVTLVVATLVFVRRPDVAPARVLFVVAGALLGSTTWSLGMQVSDFLIGAGFWLFQFTTVVAFMTYWTASFHFAAVFPEPLPWARSPAFAAAIYGVPLLGLAVYVAALWAREPTALGRVAGIGPVTGYHAAIFLTAALVALVWQLRRPLGATARRQIRWVVFGAIVAGSTGLLLYILPPLFGGDALSANAIGAIVTLFPVAVAVAVLRDNLFDIDTLLNRTLVYGTLTLGIGAAYAAVVSALALVFEARGGLGPSLVATGLVAVLFQPLRSRVQGIVNRVMYGERDDPGAVLGRLGQRLEGTLPTDAVLPTLVETVAQALRLPYVALELDGAGPRLVEFGRPTHPAVRFPLAYRGEPIGSLLVEPRAADEAFGTAELDLLETIARQASVAAYAVRASDELRRSRERLVAAREEERRRLRRDLHDGLGPTLGSLTLKLDAATNLLERQPDAARELLADLREQVQGAIVDLRSVIHALRPPTLDDLGLVGALREQALRLEHADLAVTFEAPDRMPAVPAGVEVATYRIAQEALANVVKHAGANACTVRLAVEREPRAALRLVVVDDGIGIDSRALRPRGEARGVGLGSMRARAEDLGGELRVMPRPGGGTRVTAWLPLRWDPRQAQEGRP